MKKNKLVTKPKEAGAFVLSRVAAWTLLLIICFFFVAHHGAPFEVAAMPQTVEQNQMTKASDDILARRPHISGNAGDQHISGVPGHGDQDQHISGVPGSPRGYEERERHEEREGDEGRDEHRELTVTFVRYLEFGEMTGDPTYGGKVVISPQSGEMEMIGLTGLSDLYNAAELIIQGEPNKKFHVTLPKRVDLHNSHGVTCRLTNFKAYPSQTGVIGLDGFAEVHVGATLTLLGHRSGNILGKSEGEVFVFVDYLED